jgi:hypothetical protein
MAERVPIKPKGGLLRLLSISSLGLVRIAIVMLDHSGA